MNDGGEEFVFTATGRTFVHAYSKAKIRLDVGLLEIKLSIVSVRHPAEAWLESSQALAVLPYDPHSALLGFFDGKLSYRSKKIRNMRATEVKGETPASASNATIMTVSMPFRRSFARRVSGKKSKGGGPESR